MEATQQVHHGYSDLPPTASASEVLASKFAADILKTGTEADRELLQGAIEEWSDHFKSEGLAVSDRCLVVLGEISAHLMSVGKGELSGKLAVCLDESLHAAFRQGTASNNLLLRLEAITESLFTGVSELKKNNDNIAALLPRKHIKPVKKKTISAAKALEDKNDQSEQLEREGGNPSRQTKGPSRSGQGENLLAKAGSDGEMKGGNMMQDELSQSTELNMIAQIKEHYSDPEFITLPQAKQKALMDYYIAHMLRLDTGDSMDVEGVYTMLHDLIDKGRVMKMCDKASKNEVTRDDLVDAMEELKDAVDAYYTLYGPYHIELLLNDEIPHVSLTILE